MTKARMYAEAVYSATQGKNTKESAGVVERLSALLKERGHIRLLPAIVREVAKLVRVRAEERGVVLTVAKKEDAVHYKEAIQRDVKHFDVETIPLSTSIDQTLSGGYMLSVRGLRIDRTHKRILREMYEKLVSSV